MYSRYTHEALGSCVHTEKIQVGFSMVYHGRALHDILIPRYGKYSRKHNQYDIRTAHDGKVGCNTTEYTTFFQYSD